MSVTISLARPVYLAALPAFAATPAQLTAANSVSTMVESIAVLLGPAVAAVIMHVAGPPQIFAVFAVGQLLAALLVRQPARPNGDVAGAPRPRMSLADLTDSLVELRAQPHGILLLSYVGISYLLLGMAEVLAVVLAFEILALGPAGPGILISAIGFGGMVGAGASILLAGRRRLGAALAVSLLVAGVPFAFAGLTSHLLPAVMVILAGSRGAFVAAGLMLPLLAALTWRRLQSIDAEAAAPPRSLILLLRLPMFGHLPVPIVERLARHCVPADFVPGAPVIRQGDQAEHFYVVESGQLVVMVDGQPRPSLGPGDAFSEIALVRAVQRTASVTAETGVRLWMLQRDAFLAAIAGSRRAEVVAARVVDTRLAATQGTRAQARNYRNRRR